ncbi:hypothetical protein GCM10010329_45780 [Streptomyces spiroverticillatus]|uniref:DUF4331 domain-containing protein n=1 Tax=Streptomyces finlayi TaxID=67296 RepID=A0A919CBL3_9ACTN|nr:DUF4331 domain-containing protein [Streptomyces finlayi]GHA17554.1 hypothetical protein GCM10010329_45780 [Streptomyces spiroverticillatus]GHC99424.1 hypothetical protein GCM10010334_42950 [Streptomyces finlayi]
MKPSPALPRVRRRPRTLLGGALASSVLIGAALGGPLLGTGTAGGHVDSPTDMVNSDTDLADLYAFTSPEAPDTVTLAVTVRPAQLPGNAALNYPFTTRSRYEIHVDSRGTGRPDTTYRWTFRNEDKRPFKVGPIAFAPVRSLNDPALMFRQLYTLERVRNGKAEVLVEDGIAAPSHAGAFLMPDYGALRKQAVRQLPGNIKTLATQSADPFRADIRVFGLFLAGTVGPVPGYLPDLNPLSATNVSTLLVQVPKRDLALRGDPQRNPVIGVWSTVSREGVDLSRDLRTQGPSYRQVARSGMPHVNFTIYGSTGILARPGGAEDRAQARPAADDHKAEDALKDALHPVPPARIGRLNNLPVPAGPREDIRALLYSGIGKDNGSKFGFDLNTHARNADADPDAIRPAEEMRLNMSTPLTANPKAGGVIDGDRQGFPNGRRINDHIDPPLLRMLMGEPAAKPVIPALLPPPIAKLQPAPAQNTFPYVNLPHAGL